ncbi:polyketide cyclase [Streptomyces viridiviolaceus]|uniref:SRPBCC family protein n=1 Tax=Streptomyces viridiviolaceus TaxID=68282 RepID=A0ABW2E975_9ACTN|nr:SRPBCC family protein [Streptomyces viridiviolaceus]GHB46256.1 polyketide cyclase [Streptomyces viridiviolaceus]
MTTTQDRRVRDEHDEASPVSGLKDALGGYLSAKGHSLVGRAGDRIGGLTDRLTDYAHGRGSGARGGARGGSVKATHIMETVDVGVPLRTAYDQWTCLEDFSRFTKGVRSVGRNDETGSDWNVKIGPSSRSWKATVQEQVPDERIVWTSEGAKGSTNGAVTFHALAPSLTRIVVVVEYYPSGFFEKTGNLWRAQGRRLRLDLKHFARYVTLRGDGEVEGWRGEIRDGEVVRTHEEALEEEYEYEEDDGEDETAEDDEDDGYEESDTDEDDEEGDGDDERARPRR